MRLTPISNVMQDEARLKLYEQYRNDLLTARQTVFVQFDKAVLALSGGGLALSVTFIKDIVPLDRISLIPLLISTWILFGFSILSTVFSFILSRISIDRQLRQAEEYYVQGKDAAYDMPNKAARFTTLLNYCSAGCFAGAVILTIMFVSLNLYKEREIMAERQNDVKVHQAYVPPQMQKLGSEVEVEKKGIVPSVMPKVPAPPPPEPEKTESPSQPRKTGK